jgi:exopolysaccharide biosynthesis polyprenyl glycosylphosphotransferase
MLTLRRSRRVLIVGCGPLARATIDDLRRDRTIELLGALAFEGEPIHPQLGAPVLGGAHAAMEHLTSRTVDEVYLAADIVRHHAGIQRVIGYCERLGLAFAVPAHVFRIDDALPVVSGLGQDGYIHYRTDRSHPFQELLKRSIDVAGAAMALTVLAPLLLLVVALIKLDSRGPVFFPQLRVGLRGRMFRMVKFRSMVVDADAKQRALLAANEQTGPVFKMKHDPRITRVGRFIRRYSIDELPQFWNVLVGDMSLVGPRPPLLKEVEAYEPWQRRRLSVRPGLTCFWQVAGRNAITFKEWMYLDLQYITQRSLFTDLRLIARTIPAVVSGSGAS